MSLMDPDPELDGFRDGIRIALTSTRMSGDDWSAMMRAFARDPDEKAARGLKTLMHMTRRRTLTVPDALIAAFVAGLLWEREHGARSTPSGDAPFPGGT